MPRAAAIVRSGNAGEWSPLLEGRVDLQKYAASLRRAYNIVLTPQGPTMRRSGTMKQAPVYDETKKSYLLPFIFSNDQAMQVEAANLRMRFHTEAGLLARAPVAITAVLSAAAAPLQFTAAGHGAAVGDQIVLAGFVFSTNLNGRVANVTAVAGNDVTVNVTTPAAIGSLATATSALVYHVVTTYADTDVVNLRYVFDTDTLFLFCDGHAPAKLQRYGAYDWRLTTMDFQDGPYAPVNETTTTLTPSGGTGNLIDTMTSNVLPAGFTASADSELGVGTEAFRAFDNDPLTYWEPTGDQSGWLQMQFGAGKIVDGYTIEMAAFNTDATYKALDYAPGDFVFAGSNDGITFVTLDSKVGYVVYDNGRSLYFALKNAVAYPYYRLTITKCTRNGPIPVRIARLLMTGPAAAVTVFTASAATGINSDQGWLAGDVGRLMRFQGKDGNWRPFKMTVRTSATVASFQAQGDPLSSLDANADWRLGLFSVTTGYPTCGAFFEDRLYMGGMASYPDYFAASVPGKYEVMAQTEPDGNIVDDNAIVLKLNARKQNRIVWISTDGRALLLGTGGGEWAITSSDVNQSAVTARTAKARQASRRGSANVEPIVIDAHMLMVQRANRTLREVSYDYAIDGYKSPSMSLFASHIGAPRFSQLDFAAEPHALAFARRADGTVAALTYNREEDVVGWQVFDFNGFVESISVIPATDGTQDALWLTVRRVVGGVTRRFVERMTRFWDFDSVLLDAFFVDCGVRYNGAPITAVYGLYDYEGQRIVGTADGGPITPVVVANGMITLPDAKSVLALGIGYDSAGEISRLEAGAANGTAQGKQKTIAELRLRLWQTGGGQYAVRGIDGAVTEYVDLDQYLTPQTVLDALPTLFSGDTPLLDVPQAFSTEGTVLYKQSGDIPLPMNVVAVIPTVVTQD